MKGGENEPPRDAVRSARITVETHPRALLRDWDRPKRGSRESSVTNRRHTLFLERRFSQRRRKTKSQLNRDRQRFLSYSFVHIFRMYTSDIVTCASFRQLHFLRFQSIVFLFARSHSFRDIWPQLQAPNKSLELLCHPFSTCIIDTCIIDWNGHEYGFDHKWIYNFMRMSLPLRFIQLRKVQHTSVRKSKFAK